MTTVAMAGGSAPSGTTGFTDDYVFSDGHGVALGRQTFNGQRPIHVTGLYGYMSGRGAARTAAMQFLGASTAAFVIGAAGSAGATGWQGINAYASNGGSTRFLLDFDGSTYFGRGGSGTLYTSAGVYGFSGSLSGMYDYQEAPSAPRTLTATLHASIVGRIDLAWLAPTSNGGEAVTGYVVHRSTSPTFASGVTSVTLGNVLSYAATGLTPGNTYYFRVFALNPTTAAYSTASLASNTASAAVTSGGKVRVGGTFVSAVAKVRVSGAWVTATVKVRVGGAWVSAA